MTVWHDVCKINFCGLPLRPILHISECAVDRIRRTVKYNGVTLKIVTRSNRYGGGCTFLAELEDTIYRIIIQKIYIYFY